MITPPVTRARLGELFDNPDLVDKEETRHMAEELFNARRSAGTKTLRDEFAMMAMKDCMALKADGVAKRAYEIADAMMKERSK